MTLVNDILAQARFDDDPRELRAAAALARRLLLREQRRAKRSVFIGPDQDEAAAIADFIDRLVQALLAEQAGDGAA